MTRRIVMPISVSADGFFETPDGDIGWGRVDDEVHEHFNEVLRPMATFLQGRVTYEQMDGFWSSDDDELRRPGPVRDFAQVWRDVPKVVYSRTLTGVGEGATLEREVDPAAVRALKAQPGGDMTVGGPDLAATLLRHGLVDEVRLYVHPVVIGRGRRPFAEDADLDLSLLESRAFGNGVVLLRYAVAGAAGRAPAAS